MIRDVRILGGLILIVSKGSYGWVIPSMDNIELVPFLIDRGCSAIDAFPLLGT